MGTTADWRFNIDAVQQWHIHECTFQMVYVLNGWATFEYADVGEQTIRKGDCINSAPAFRTGRSPCPTISRCSKWSRRRTSGRSSSILPADAAATAGATAACGQR